MKKTTILWDGSPDGTYFRMSDVTPVIRVSGDKTVFTVFSGTGYYRSSWGSPKTTTSIVFRGRTLIAFHVGFHHKHRGSQGYHYFVYNGHRWQKVRWNQLTRHQQKKVLDRWRTKTPHWARCPGKLK